MPKKKTEAQVQETQAEAPAPAAPKAPNIGAVAREAIMAGKTNQEALDIVKATFPDANTTLNSINWYRNDLRKKGANVPKVERPKKAAVAAAAASNEDLTK